MYRFLLSRQWVILTLVGLVLIPVMIKLGFWQLHRHENRVAHNDLIARSLDAPAVPVGELTAPGRDVPRDVTWRKVTATGRYDTRHEVVVRQRTGSDEQSIGYFVVTPLLLTDGRAVLVNRGWIPPGDDLTRFPEVPAPPRGEVTVTGRLKAAETTGSSGIKDKKGLPDRQVMLINSERLGAGLGRPVLGGYIELITSSPKGTKQPEPVPPPDHSSIGAHLAYAVQWWLFAAGVPAGWIVLVRRERRDRAAAAAAKAAEQAPAGAAPPAGGTGPSADGNAAAADEPTATDEDIPAGGNAPAADERTAADETTAADGNLPAAKDTTAADPASAPAGTTPTVDGSPGKDRKSPDGRAGGASGAGTSAAADRDQVLSEK